MAEYINRDDVLDLSYCPTSLTWDNPLAEQKSVVDVDDINSIPTADVVEVRHGKWEWRELYGIEGLVLVCSECRESEGACERFDYCPNCGAKMDGGKNND